MGNIGDKRGAKLECKKYLHFLEERESGQFWWETSWEILGLENSVLQEKVRDFIYVLKKKLSMHK